MKILHVITLSELGGAQSVLLNLARKSIEDGHEVMVAASAGGDLWKELPPQVQKYKIASLKREISLIKDWQVIKTLKSINRSFKPDIIHLHSSKIGTLGRIAFPSKKIIYTVHGFDSIRVQYRKFLFLERLLQFSAAKIVAVSKYDYENLKRENITRNLSLIYNGIEDHTIDIVEKKNLTNRPSIITKSEKTFIVLCIARLAPPKRFDIFRETALMLSEDGIQFYWVGNKEPVSDLPPNLRCLGEVDAAYQLLRSCDLLLLPSDYEGLPISILEAFCFSTPVIASNVGGVSEMVNGKNGYAVDNVPQMFAKYILHFKNNPELLSEARKQARASYLKSFALQKMYSAYDSLYTDICKS